MALHTGDIVDRYLLLDCLGAGSFGEVWKASQLVDGEDVGIRCAVKFMKLTQEAAGSSPRSVASGWLDEVRNLGRAKSVGGDAIPRIHEANVWNHHAYIAMELLEGTTLGARLARGPIAWRRALYIADQIARALEAAHQIGVVHRDLKPQNVMLEGPHRVCVIDWGIARLRNSARGSTRVVRRPATDVNATDPAPVAAIVVPPSRRVGGGTPGYMAPEIYDGALPSAAQDVYALGVVLYEMIAGCLPHAVTPLGAARTPDLVDAYRAALDRATMDHALVPLRDRCPDLPEAVYALVDALLSRDPEQRPCGLRARIDMASRFPHGVPDPPYAGLMRLGPERAGLYFGQHDAVQHVLERLRTQRGVLLWGPSGSGKSSLALAGVAETMDRTLFAGTEGWVVHVIRPRERRAPRLDPGSRGLVVVIDQLEEVVDLGPDEQREFCDAVLALLTTTDEVRVIATIRDDLEWRVDREVPALRPLLDLRVIVKGVDANFARSIIAEPARAHGYDIENLDAVTREVEEALSADPAKLPVVQFALSEWWQRRDRERKTLPLAVWVELGGVEGTLSFVAERFYTGLSAADQEHARALFLRCFTDRVRRAVVEAELGDADRVLVDELVRLRLFGRRDHKGVPPVYEVEHESLANNWGRLAAWLDEARDDRQLLDELEQEARLWTESRDPERLWSKRRLIAAQDLVNGRRLSISDTATTFLHVSRSAMRRRQLVAIAAMVAVVALTMAITPWELNRLAVAHQRASAAEQAAKSEEQRAKEAEQSAKQAEQRAKEAEQSAKQAEQRTREAEQRAKDEKQQLENAEQSRLLAEAAAKQAKEAFAVASQRATTLQIAQDTLQAEMERLKSTMQEPKKDGYVRMEGLNVNP
ncbi:MAG TPA: protein kinase [Kofleriaceae bacterium]|jgi:hypothetical protein|nr:protein kinase [Kofleriaceae bacterium]